MQVATGSEQGDTLAAAEFNLASYYALQVLQLNQNLLTTYNAAVSDYNAMMQSGSFSSVPPLRPAPASWIYVPADGQSNFFPGMQQTGPPIVPTVAIATTNNANNPGPNTAPNVIMIGVAIVGGGGKWFQALPGDTFPSGKTTPPMSSADGVFGVYEKFGAAVGAGWYFLTS